MRSIWEEIMMPYKDLGHDMLDQTFGTKVTEDMMIKYTRVYNTSLDDIEMEEEDISNMELETYELLKTLISCGFSSGYTNGKFYPYVGQQICVGELPTMMYDDQYVRDFRFPPTHYTDIHYSSMHNTAVYTEGFFAASEGETFINYSTDYSRSGNQMIVFAARVGDKEIFFKWSSTEIVKIEDGNIGFYVGINGEMVNMSSTTDSIQGTVPMYLDPVPQLVDGSLINVNGDWRVLAIDKSDQSSVDRANKLLSDIALSTHHERNPIVRIYKPGTKQPNLIVKDYYRRKNYVYRTKADYIRWFLLVRDKYDDRALTNYLSYKGVFHGNKRYSNYSGDDLIVILETHGRYFTNRRQKSRRFWTAKNNLSYIWWYEIYKYY